MVFFNNSEVCCISGWWFFVGVGFNDRIVCLGYNKRGGSLFFVWLA